MSETALCNAVVQQITNSLNCPSKGWIDVTPDGQPPTVIVAPVFVGVFEEGWTYTGFSGSGGYIRNMGSGLNNGIQEEYYISVTVSVKLAANHKQFWGTALNMSWDGSLGHAVRGIIECVHQRPELLVLANAQIDTAVSSPIVEMLKAMSVGKKEPQRSEWWERQRRPLRSEPMMSSDTPGPSGSSAASEFRASETTRKVQ